MIGARCKEQHETIPFSFEHIWNADIHGLPVGDCLKCGLSYMEYHERSFKLSMKILYPQEAA